jgi:hypothetical protein
MQSGGANPSSAKFNLIAARLSIRSRLMRRTPSPTDFSALKYFLRLARAAGSCLLFNLHLSRSFLGRRFLSVCCVLSICQGVPKGSDWGYGVAPNGGAAACKSLTRIRLIDGRYI